MKELHRNIRIVGRLAVSFSLEKETASRPVPSSFTEYSPWEAPMEAPAHWRIPIPEKANGTYMQSTDDISKAKTARALQTASHAHIAA